VTQAQRQTLQREIQLLQGQIKLVENQISATDRKIDLTTEEMGEVQVRIGVTREEMSRKRETVGRMILYLEQRDREDLVASLFKFANLSSFLTQFHDLNNVQTRLLGLIGDLKDSKQQLESQHVELTDKQVELEDLLEDAEHKRSQLSGVKGERDRVLKVTKGQEALYQKQISDIERQSAELFNELNILEKKVVSGGLYIVHVTATSVPPRGTKLFVPPYTGYRLTQGYGMTAYARRGAYGGAGHNGIDLVAGYGSAIRAIGAGTVIANGTNKGWGNWIAVRHANNMVSVYAHMSSIARGVSAAVQQGEIVGFEGNTGHVTGPHLHLSLYRDFFTYLKGTELYFNYFEGSLNPLDYM
jgi:murein DD-endopeptidase MepM/ murein hydrolase activator NlpD